MSLAETTPAAPKKKAAQNSVVTLKITLRGSKPPIWRRVMMPGASTLAKLHFAIVASMGWTGGHLHQFDVDGRLYGDRSDMPEFADERRPTLNGLVKSGVKRFSYTYDFGDDWEHVITIEKVAQVDAPPPGPTCIAGKRACPPEDCGGVWGYHHHLLEVLADPNHPEYEEQTEWLDGDFDPEDFEIDDVNERFGVKTRST